jgi:hypothetical protein
MEAVILRSPGRPKDLRLLFVLLIHHEPRGAPS